MKMVGEIDTAITRDFNKSIPYHEAQSSSSASSTLLKTQKTVPQSGIGIGIEEQRELSS
jgi:hypothetical protein